MTSDTTRDSPALKGVARRRTLADYVVGLSAIALVILIGVATLALAALLIWLIVDSFAAILSFLGTALIIVVASVAYRQIKGE